MAVRRCAQYRKAFRWAAVSYPFDVLSLADVDVADWGRTAVDLTAMADTIGDAVETGCIAARFGRPAVNVSPSVAALVPCRQRAG